jgi:hypothetical protein
MAAASGWSRAAVAVAGVDAVEDHDEDDVVDEDGDAQAPAPEHALAPKLAADVVVADVAAAIALLLGGQANDNDERLMDMGVSPGGVGSWQQVPCRPHAAGRHSVLRPGRTCRAAAAGSAGQEMPSERFRPLAGRS